MLPLVGIAAAFLPDLVKLIAGDKAGSVATDVAKAVSTATGTDDPVLAKQKLQTDPIASADLQVKLAQIALDATKLQNDEQERKHQDELAQQQARHQTEDQKRKDEFAQLQSQLQAEEQKRKDQLAELQTQLQADIANTAAAHSFERDLVQSGSPIMWAPPIVSVVVTVSFLAVVILLAYPQSGAAFKDNQLLNICVGALVAGFTTVISYWLGSSQGSRDKEATNRQLQNSQAVQANELIKAQTERLKNVPVPAPQGRSDASVPDKPVARTDKFERCLQLVFGAEGGFANDAADPGGPTNFGITQATLANWRKDKGDKTRAVTADEVRKLTRNEATEIYRTDYWAPLKCNELPSGVDLVVFDFGVNAGPGTSAMLLQKIVGVTQDGSVGPITIAALKTMPPTKVISEFSSRRLDFYRALPDFPRFGAGWTNRTHDIEHAALAMAG
jgi:hypothetical protein